MFRLLVAVPGGEPVTLGPVRMDRVAAYRAMTVLMNADPAVHVPVPVSYFKARQFAEELMRQPKRSRLRHGPTGLVFSIIDGQG